MGVAMSRDKQLQVRLEHEVREKFKELCQEHDLEMSAFLYSLIRHFVDGTIPIQSFLKPTDSAIDSEAIADIKKSILAELSEIVQDEVQTAIAALEANSVPPPNTQHVSHLPQAEENLPRNNVLVATTTNESGEGLSSAELAEKLQISLPAVKSWAQRWKKSPAEFKPKGSEAAIAIPAYIYRDKKWYPAEEN
jgi:predicted house-cleaning noncanonical NTP pyrophosphatase (MazG superfamily)